MPERVTEEKGPMLYMVVCTKLHVALGPFADLKMCVEYAKELTGDRKDKCKYLPVPMVMRGTVIVEKDSPTPDGHVGQYL